MKSRTREHFRIGVLAIMPQGDERERLRRSAEGEPWTVEYCVSVAEAIGMLRSGGEFAAVVLDRDVPGAEWKKAVADLAGSAPAARIMLASGEGGEGLWQRVVEQGGHDVLSKPLRPEEVRRAVLHAHWARSVN